jgi:hypothetical protein
MARFGRPELEKDNPMAPQPYVGPRRRRALSHDAASSRADARGDLKKTLQNLVAAAERFVNGVPRSKKLEEERNTLLDAITQAEWLLSVKQMSAKRPARASKKV